MFKEPDYGTLYLLLDEGGIPYAICTYLDMLMCIEDECWPQCQEDVEMLLFCFDAYELGRTVHKLELEARKR